MGEKKEEKIGKRLEAQKRLGKLIGEHYKGAHEAKKMNNQLIAWTTTAAPNEILWAMDFYVQYPEAYSATCGARHAAHDHCVVTENYGYEHHLCTYARNSLGSTLAEINGKEAFDPLAKPDFLLVSNGSCLLITKWFEHLSHYWKIPMFNIDSPLIIPEMEQKELIDHVKRQCLDLIKFLEDFTGKKFDYDRFKEVVENSAKSAAGYRELININRHDPIPATYFDMMSHNFPNLVLRYKPEVAEHYRLMNEELGQRITDGVVPMQGMKHRVYWDGVPYWFAMKFLSQKLQSLGMGLVTSAYSEVFTYGRLDSSRPLESVAENAALFYLNRGVRYKAEFTKKLFEDFNMDSCIFAYALSCKPFSISMHYIADYVQKNLGIKVTIIEGDLVDETFFDEEKTGMKLEALAESLV